MSSNKLTGTLWKNVHKLDSWDTDHDFPTANAIAFNRYHVNPYAKEKKEKNLGDLTFLDIGCGSGANVVYLGGFGYDISAIDSSTEAVQKTLNNAKQVGIDINCYIADFKDLPFDDNSFDAILSDGVFYYGDESSFKTAVKEAYRVLKKNGLMRIYTKSNRDCMAIESNKVSVNTYMIKTGYEKGMTVFCAPKDLIKTIF